LAAHSNPETWVWSEVTDPFSALNDRQDQPPLSRPRLPLPKIRIVLVRHGQSTWNARNRIQGSSNFSVLTEKGILQSETSAQLLKDWQFQAMFHSPLKRAAQTATIIWKQNISNGRNNNKETDKTANSTIIANKKPKVKVLPSLREIDLYSLQGCLKLDGKAALGDIYTAWQKTPAEFELDGHAPVRELWYRGSVAWKQIMRAIDMKGGGPGPGGGGGGGGGGEKGQEEQRCQCLVVAHNAVNQALICTALGLPPSYFRRLVQSNAAFTVLDFELDSSSSSSNSGGGHQFSSSPSSPPEVSVTLERLNQAPEAPFKANTRDTAVKLILICGEKGGDEVRAALKLLADNGLTAVPLIALSCQDILTATEAVLARSNSSSSNSNSRNWNGYSNNSGSRNSNDNNSNNNDNNVVLIVASSDVCRKMLARCLDQDESAFAPKIGMSEGGISVVTLIDGNIAHLNKSIILCVNYH